MVANQREHLRKIARTLCTSKDRLSFVVHVPLIYFAVFVSSVQNVILVPGSS